MNRGEPGVNQFWPIKGTGKKINHFHWLKCYFYLSPPTLLAQWLAVLVLETAYGSLRGGNRDGRNPGEIGVGLPCELAPMPKYPRFDLAIGGAGGGEFEKSEVPTRTAAPNLA